MSTGAFYFGLRESAQEKKVPTDTGTLEGDQVSGGLGNDGQRQAHQARHHDKRKLLNPTRPSANLTMQSFPILSHDWRTSIGTAE
jgi:hypothetical protein